METGDLIGISIEEVEEISKALQSCSHLKGLSLINCGMGREEMEALAVGLKDSKNLESLNLSENGMEDDGAEIIIKLMETNTSIKHLDLTNCNVGLQSGELLTDMMENNETLRSLILDDNGQLPSSIVAQLFELLKTKTNIVNFSALNTYCDVKNMGDVFGMIRKNQNILYVGFPKFFNKRRTYVDSMVSTKKSLNEVRREDLIPFGDNIIQKPLLEALKANFSLVRIHNPQLTQGAIEVLKTNLSSLKKKFSSILQNENASASDATEQKILVLGRKSSGKSALLEALFGNAFDTCFKYYELELKEKMLLVSKPDSVNFHVKELDSHALDDLSFQVASRRLSKNQAKMDKNEKIQMASRGRAIQSTKKKGRKNFYNIPKSESPRRSQRSSRKSPNSSTSRGGGNYLLTSRGRKGKAKSRQNSRRSRASSSDSYRRSSFSSDGISDSVKMNPSMTNSLIGRSFDPSIIARYGAELSPDTFFISVREITNRVSNVTTAKTNSFGSARSLASRNTRGTGTGANGKKLSDAEKYGSLNNSLIDLNNVMYGLKENDGICMITFDLVKLLRYIQVKKEQMIVVNPIVTFIKGTLDAIYNASNSNFIALIGTRFDTEVHSPDDLNAVNKLLEHAIPPRNRKKLIRYKQAPGNLLYFPVDSVSSKNIGNLRQLVLSKLGRMAKQKGRSSEVPIKWLRARDVLVDHCNNGNSFISKQKYYDKIENIGFEKIEDIEPLLKFLCKRSDIILFPEVDLLKDFIVIDKKFLYFLMYQILNRKYITKVLNQKAIKELIKKEDLMDDLRLFKAKKLLSRDLIEFVWKNNSHVLLNKSSDISTEEHFDTNRAAYLYILEMMKKMLFVTEFKSTSFNLNSNLRNAVGLGGTMSHKEFTEEKMRENLFIVPSLMKLKVSSSSSSAQNRLKHVKSFKETKSHRGASPRQKSVTASTQKRGSNASQRPISARLQSKTKRKKKLGMKNDERKVMQSSRRRKDVKQSGRPRGRSKEKEVFSQEDNLEQDSSNLHRHRTGTEFSSAAMSSRGGRKAQSLDPGISKTQSTGVDMFDAIDPLMDSMKSIKSTKTLKNDNTSAKMKRNKSRPTSSSNRKDRRRKTGTGQNKNRGRRKSNGKRRKRPSSHGSSHSRDEVDVKEKLKANKKGLRMKSHDSTKSEDYPSVKVNKSMRKPMQKRKDFYTTLPRSTKGKCLLDRNQPVSVLLDFKEKFLPTGFFLRLCSVMFGLCVQQTGKKTEKFPHHIESVELYKNYMKISFDKLVQGSVEEKEEISDISTLGGMSIGDSDFESISVTGAKRMTRISDGSKGASGDKDYIVLLISENNDSIVCIVRDHDKAGIFLNMLSESVQMISPQEEDVGELNDHSMMFFNFGVDPEMVKVEVKSNKFVTVKVAEEDKFAPWFSKYKPSKQRGRNSNHSRVMLEEVDHDGPF